MAASIAFQLYPSGFFIVSGILNLVAFSLSMLSSSHFSDFQTIPLPIAVSQHHKAALGLFAKMLNGVACTVTTFSFVLILGGIFGFVVPVSSR